MDYFTKGVFCWLFWWLIEKMDKNYTAHTVTFFFTSTTSLKNIHNILFPLNTLKIISNFDTALIKLTSFTI